MPRGGYALTLAAVLGAAPAAQPQNVVQTPDAVFSRLCVAKMAQPNAMAAAAPAEVVVPT